MSELAAQNEQTVKWQIICRESCILAERDKRIFNYYKIDKTWQLKLQTATSKK